MPYALEVALVHTVDMKSLENGVGQCTRDSENRDESLT